MKFTKTARSVCIGSQHFASGSLSSSTALTLPTGYSASAITLTILKPRAGGPGIYLRLEGGDATSSDMEINSDVPVEITSDVSKVELLEQSTGAVVDVWYFV